MGVSTSINVAVIGAGSWGTTVAALASANTPTTLWARRSELADQINNANVNPSYLPSFTLPENLRATDSLADAVSDADVVVMGVPSHGYRDVAAQVADYIRPWVPVVTLAKGIERASLKRMSEVTADEIPGHPIAVLTGPNLAKEITALLERERPRTVVNFAAESHVDRSIDSPRPFVDTNIVGTFVLLEATRQLLGKLAPEARDRFRLLHVSTDEVFGSLGATGLFSETTRYAPNSPYAASKASADHLVRAYHRTYGLPTLLTNCSNNYGPYQFPEKLIPLVILNALEGRDLPIYGDGLNVRDWLYVEDHCDGILRVLARGQVGESYNIGGGAELPNVAVVDAICEALEREAPAAENQALIARGLGDYKALKTFVADRQGHDRRYAIDAGKIRRELGWEARHDFTAGIAATVRWYVENRDWCTSVQSTGAYDRQRLGTPGDDGVTR